MIAKRLVVLLLLVVGIGFLAISPVSAAARVVPVRAVDNAFVPYTAPIYVGDTIRWANRGYNAHTTHSDDDLWYAELAPREIFAYTFLAPGTFTYHCDFHPQMTGRVIVRALPNG